MAAACSNARQSGTAPAQTHQCRPWVCRVAVAVWGMLLLAGPQYGQKNAPLPLARAGLVTRTITPAVRRNWRGAVDHSLHVLVWYPAADTSVETLQTIGPPDKPLFDAGHATPHAAFAPSLQPFPLILLSHGAGSSAQQLGWLGTALARAGFIVAAVDHPGDHADATLTPEGFLLWWERATDLSEVLDGLLADPELGPHIDKDRIGAAGFSLGGYTALELAGARTDLAAFFDTCRKTQADPVCRPPDRSGLPATGNLLEAVRKTSGESLARAADSFRDPRVRAALALAPALGFALTSESLRAIRVPVLVVAGAADAIAPAVTSANLIRAQIHGARETVLPNVAHNTFLDTCTAEGRQTLPELCTDPAGVEREAVHTAVSDLAAQFFAHAFHLR